jgi:hypothetical protein
LIIDSTEFFMHSSEIPSCRVIQHLFGFEKSVRECVQPMLRRQMSRTVLKFHFYRALLFVKRNKNLPGHGKVGLLRTFFGV